LAKYRKPSFFLSRIVNPLLMALGAVPVLGTRGRSSGEWRRIPVNVLDLDGRRYIVAPRGDTHWARNLLACPEAELKQQGRTEQLEAIPVPDGAKQPIIAAYLDRWASGSRGDFEALPYASDHPVFRLETPERPSAGQEAGAAEEPAAVQPPETREPPPPEPQASRPPS
jgi:deazaflavin-dependent oxidoreductase (nitroreductase family)